MCIDERKAVFLENSTAGRVKAPEPWTSTSYKPIRFFYRLHFRECVMKLYN